MGWSQAQHRDLKEVAEGLGGCRGQTGMEGQAEAWEELPLWVPEPS